MTKKYQRGGVDSVVYEAPVIDDNYENVLLIIDPQNDFSDVNSAVGRNNPGRLAVTGSTQDYARIIKFIEKNNAKLSEIHVSLDTHTRRHIGHPGFWSRVTSFDKDRVTEFTKCDPEEGFRTLPWADTKVETCEWGNNNCWMENGTFQKIILNSNFPDDAMAIKLGDGTIIYKGTSVVPEQFRNGELDRYFIPKQYNDNDNEYKALRDYVDKYIRFYSTTHSKHGLVPWIWKYHCILETYGHKVAEELQNFLNKEEVQGKVKYHIKGQNNLAEMYSIFSAEMPVNVIDLGIDSYVYTRDNVKSDYDISDGVSNYDDIAGKVNLNTELNTMFMDKLLGTNKQRRVYICGEAKTHCVKSSLIDLMDYAKDTKQINDPKRIVLLANMTSPIQGSPDDIEKLTTNKGFTVLEF
jgi:nicotinamidase-related amidase